MDSAPDKLTLMMKEALEKDSGKEVTLEEAEDAARNLTGLAEILLESYFKDKKREERLKEEPKGFPLEGGYSCLICGEGGSRNGGIWYDKWGQKCMVCQRAVDKGDVPGWVAKHRDSWYSKYDLESRFNLKTIALKKWLKEGIIKPRNILSENGRTHCQIFLIYDNKGFLPPKRMTESQIVRTEKDGQIWHKPLPWFRFVDPFEHIKGYKIMEHMRRVPLDN